MKDEKRADFIVTKAVTNTDPIDAKTGGVTIRENSYKTMAALYEVIDTGRSNLPSLQGSTAERARDLSVEFISRSPEDYSPQLKSLVSEVSH
jgi:hypothetical protein